MDRYSEHKVAQKQLHSRQLCKALRASQPFSQTETDSQGPRTEWQPSGMALVLPARAWGHLAVGGL